MADSIPLHEVLLTLLSSLRSVVLGGISPPPPPPVSCFLPLIGQPPSQAMVLNLSELVTESLMVLNIDQLLCVQSCSFWNKRQQRSVSGGWCLLDKVRHFTSVEFNKDFIYRFLSPPQAFENQDDDEGVLGLSLSDN